MFGFVATDGVIGLSRTSFIEQVTLTSQPNDPIRFPETQITNDNTQTITYLKKMIGGDSIECSVIVVPPPPAPIPSIQWSFLGFGFLDYHVAAVFQLNDGQALTQALYQDAFTQTPLAVVNVAEIPGQPASENIAVFERDFAPVAPPGENFIVPDGICGPSATATPSSADVTSTDALSQVVSSFPWIH
jgi:hypothetical protein